MKGMFGIVVALVLTVGIQVHAADSDAVSQAEASAASWLALVDAAKYAESWNNAALVFKGAVTEADWEKAVRSVRTPLGALKARKLKSATFARSLPGAPDGEYVVLQYYAQFENKAAAIETVTPMRDPDGTWKVSGYYVK
jgi:hypothetical protein